jgi:hypothetical protein
MTDRQVVQRMCTGVREQKRETIVALFAPDFERIRFRGGMQVDA